MGKRLEGAGRMVEKTDSYLIIDDEPDMCWVLENILTGLGLVSKKALSGQQALELFQRFRFKSVFLDAKLPDIDGLELARQIRRYDNEVTVIMISGYYYRDDTDVQRAIEEGLISGFISKPFQHYEISKVLGIPPNGS
jgi:CheY-like chemotaxis protein